MKNNFLYEGISKIKNITLSPEEKGAVLSRLLEQVREHPAVTVPARVSVFTWSGPRLGYAMAGVLLMLLAGGSVATATAGGALPGDILYPVKIYVNEPLLGALTVGDVPKARFEADKTVRRLEEAESLAAQGRLDQSSVATIKDNYQKSSHAFNAIIQNSESKGQSEEMDHVRTDFEAQISAHAQILSTVEDNATSTEKGDTAPLGNVDEKNEDTAKEERLDIVPPTGVASSTRVIKEDDTAPRHESESDERNSSSREESND